MEVLILEDGKVLSWGHGGHGQLGHSSIQNQKVPTMIEALADECVVSIACGGSASAAVTGYSLLIFSFHVLRLGRRGGGETYSNTHFRPEIVVLTCNT